MHFFAFGLEGPFGIATIRVHGGLIQAQKKRARGVSLNVYEAVFLILYGVVAR